MLHIPSAEPLSASKLVIEPSASPKPIPDASTLVFGQTFTDHMLTCKWNIERGWDRPVISEYKDLAISPAATVLHYAPTLFEGLKAYKDKQGRTRLFRPDLNMARMIRGAQRMAFPTFEGDELIELIKELLRVDERWMPTEPGTSMYIRPTMIGTRASLGVGPSTEVLLFVIMSPVAKYYSSGAKPVSLLCSENHVRAWPKGTGDCKFGLNYAAAVAPQMEAAQKGYQQVLWLLEDELTEVGMMNCFAGRRTEDQGLEIITPPLSEIILPGVTRNSVLALLRAHANPSHPFKLDGVPSQLTVSERRIFMSELASYAQDGSLAEVFGSGTAAIITSVERIGYKGDDVRVPVEGSETTGFGAVAGALYEALQAIQYGDDAFENWSVLV